MVRDNLSSQFPPESIREIPIREIPAPGSFVLTPLVNNFVARRHHRAQGAQRYGSRANWCSSPASPCLGCSVAMAEGMRVRLPTTIAAEDGLPSEEQSPSKSKPAQARLLHRLLNRHTILLLMLALTVRRSALTHVFTAPS